MRPCYEILYILSTLHISLAQALDQEESFYFLRHLEFVHIGFQKQQNLKKTWSLTRAKDYVRWKKMHRIS